MTVLIPILKTSQLFRILKIPEHAGCDGHGPCIHGICELAQNGTYVCNCDEGWYGTECEVPGKNLCLHENWRSVSVSL